MAPTIGVQASHLHEALTESALVEGDLKGRNNVLCQPTRLITVDVHCSRLLYGILVLNLTCAIAWRPPTEQTDTGKPL